MATLAYLYNPSVRNGSLCCLLVAVALAHSRELPFGRLSQGCHLVARYSYGIYLTHGIFIWLAFDRLAAWPIGARWILFLLATALCPIAVYHTIEAPMIGWGSRLIRSAARSKSQATAVPAGNEASACRHPEPPSGAANFVPRPAGAGLDGNAARVGVAAGDERHDSRREAHSHSCACPSRPNTARRLSPPSIGGSTVTFRSISDSIAPSTHSHPVPLTGVSWGGHRWKVRRAGRQVVALWLPSPEWFGTNRVIVV